ncbi:MAG: anti-sigma factor family protein [Gammaproteobacteria bacterium]
MLTCKDVSILVSDAQDRRLMAREWFQVRLHLLICVACHNFAQQLRLLRGAARRHHDQ